VASVTTEMGGPDANPRDKTCRESPAVRDSALLIITILNPFTNDLA